MENATMTAFLLTCFDNNKGVSALMNESFYVLSDMKQFMQGDITRIQSEHYDESGQQVLAIPKPAQRLKKVDNGANKNFKFQSAQQ